MREITFRGKRIDNGEWVYGDICHHDGVVSYIGQRPFDGSMVICDLIPETVGQYTGLKDKNGKEIYEGDIVRAWSQGTMATGKVERRVDGLWIMFPAYQNKQFWGLCPNHCGDTSVEVIGNIHEGVTE